MALPIVFKEALMLISRIDGVFTEVEHHRIAAKLKAMSDEWDEIEDKTGAKPPKAFDYTFGLLNGCELIFHSPSEKVDEMRQKILAIHRGK